MDPRTLFYQQVDLLINGFKHASAWSIRKDLKNNIVTLIPPEWLSSSQAHGVSLQFALNVRGELVLSVSVESPIPLENRAEFKADLYRVLHETGMFAAGLKGFEPNLNQRGKFVKKTMPLLSDSHKDLLSYLDHAMPLIPVVQSLIRTYKANGKFEGVEKSSPRSKEDLEDAADDLEPSENGDVVFDEGEPDYGFEYKDDRKIFTHKAEPTVEHLHKQMKRGRLNLQPDFQRQFVWDKAKASSLIESLLLDVPLPIVYLAEDSDSTLMVIDGQQRLSSLFSFIDGCFPDGRRFGLVGLKILRDLNQKTFAEISEKHQDKLESSPLSVIIVKKESDPELKFEIFERLNTGSVKLNDQELRNCIYRGKYLDLLKELSKDPDYQYIMGFKGLDKRMKDVEYVLRFAAFYHQTYLKYLGGMTMSNFLNNEMQMYQDISDVDEEDLIGKFRKAVQINKSLFGNRSFRKIKRGEPGSPDATWKNTTVVNASLYDTLMVGLLHLDKNMIYRNLDAIREAVIYLVTEDERFVETIEKWTSAGDQIRKKFAIFNATIDAIVENDNAQARCFSHEFKERLFRLNKTCAICGQQIYSLEDAAVDHIDQYWLGGKTIPENARLAHRYCNSSRRRKES
jgi:hypothetical protein